MGCDIHAVFQAKIDGQWQDVQSDYDENRDYDFFGWLAGVRHESEHAPVAQCRGFPTDFQEDAGFHQLTYAGGRERSMGEHNYSWAGADELIAAPGAGEFNYFIDEVKKLRDRYGEVRFVFGFDS